MKKWLKAEKVDIKKHITVTVKIKDWSVIWRYYDWFLKLAFKRLLFFFDENCLKIIDASICLFECLT